MLEVLRLHEQHSECVGDRRCSLDGEDCFLQCHQHPGFRLRVQLGQVHFYDHHAVSASESATPRLDFTESSASTSAVASSVISHQHTISGVGCAIVEAYDQTSSSPEGVMAYLTSIVRLPIVTTRAISSPKQIT